MVMRLRGEALFAARSWRPHFYRGGLYAIGAFAFVYSLRYLPFAEVVAIAFAGPMFMTLFGRFFLGESVGWHRLGAVVVGFIGVLFVIQPGTEAMHWAVVLPLIVALADATRDLVTRQMAGGESSLRIVFSTGCILALAGLITLVGGWQPLRIEHLHWFGLSASAFVIAHFLMVEAFRHGQTGGRCTVSLHANHLDHSRRDDFLGRSPGAGCFRRHRYYLCLGYLYRLARSHGRQIGSMTQRVPD